MSLFIELGYIGRLDWIGYVEDRESSLRTNSTPSLDLGLDGIRHDSHAGLTRPACVRSKELYQEGTEIRNTRQLTVVSSEEIDEIASEMRIDKLVPSLLGANLMVAGIPYLTLLPPSSRLQFLSGPTLVVDLINLPCNLPAREIEKEIVGKGRMFKQAAHNRRGVACWVEREGTVKLGDSVRLFIPRQPIWPAL